MCGRFTSTSDPEQLAELFGVDDVVVANPLPPRWNVAPSAVVYAIAGRRAPAGLPGAGAGAEGRPRFRRQLGAFRWGLVPPWAAGPAAAPRMINVRADTLARQPAFAQALARRRCIIPADAFYEWQAPSPEGAGPPQRAKLPWAVRRNDGQPMAFAGVWSQWREPAPPAAPGLAAVGETGCGSPGDTHAQGLRTCAIVTTEANGLLAPIHSRMPVVLPSSAWDVWLDSALHDAAALHALLVPAPSAWFEAFTVSSRANSAANEGPELLDPAPPPGASAAGTPGTEPAQPALFGSSERAAAPGAAR